MNEIRAVFTKIDRWIRQDCLTDAKKAVLEIEVSELSASEREEIASFYRRLSLPRIAIQILRPLVVGSGRRLANAAISTQIEYAANLIQLGLIDEARLFLSLEKMKNEREAKRWQAFSFLYDFQLPKAARAIREILDAYPSESYEGLVVKLNYLIALLSGLSTKHELTEFARISSQVKQEIENQNAHRLRGVFASVQAQAVFFSNSPEKLDFEFELSEDYQSFFKTFVSLFHEARAGRVPRPLLTRYKKNLREHALNRNWYDGVRELDFHFARLFDPDYAALVKEGTHYVHYQTKYEIKSASVGARCFDRKIISDLKTFSQLKPGYEIKRMPELPSLNALFHLFVSEQYSPLSTFAIWNRLASETHFTEPHSSNRVYQWIKRLKHWLSVEKIPAEIITDSMGYKLVPKTLLYLPRAQVDFGTAEERLYQNLKLNFGSHNSFSIQEVASFYPGLTRRELQYRLKALVETRLLERSGKARSTRYHL